MQKGWVKELTSKESKESKEQPLYLNTNLRNALQISTSNDKRPITMDK